MLSSSKIKKMGRNLEQAPFDRGKKHYWGSSIGDYGLLV